MFGVGEIPRQPWEGWHARRNAPAGYIVADDNHHPIGGTAEFPMWIGYGENTEMMIMETLFQRTTKRLRSYANTIRFKPFSKQAIRATVTRETPHF